MPNLKTKIISLIANIDSLVESQLEAIISQDDFQQILSRWSEIALLVSATKLSEKIKIKILNINWQEINKDLNTTADIDTSNLFQKIYEEEIGITGGEPFNVLLGQYELDLSKPNIISNLHKLSELSAYCLAPFLSNVSAETFGSKNYGAISDFSQLLTQTSLDAWTNLRKNKYARFMYLLLPDVYINLFNTFINSVNTRGIVTRFKIQSNILLTLQLIASFDKTGWFDSIAGIFNAYDYENDLTTIFPSSLKIDISPSLYLSSEDEVTAVHHGIIPFIYDCSTQQCHFNTVYAMSMAENPVDLLLEHLLCACRLGHYIKIHARNKIGSYRNLSECENFINQWLNKYTSTTRSMNLKHHFPLKSHQVQLLQVPGKPGHYSCSIQLEPHMNLEALNSKIILKSEIIDR